MIEMLRFIAIILCGIAIGFSFSIMLHVHCKKTDKFGLDVFLVKEWWKL